MVLRGSTTIALTTSALAACAPAAAPPAATPSLPAATILHRAFVIHFEGARIGYAVEDERVTTAGSAAPRRQLSRREVVRLRRSGSVTSFETQLVIRGAATGEADELEVTVRHCEADSLARLPAPSLTAPLELSCPGGAQLGAFTARATARRTAEEWQLTSTLGATAKTLPFAAQPAEWLDTRPDDELHELRRQPIFFASRGFALGHADRHWLDARTWIGSVSLRGKVLGSTTVLDEDRRPRLVLDENGGTATRIADELIAFPTLDLADLVALTSIDVRGRLPAPGAHRRLVLARPGLTSDAATSPPPEAPGQRVTGAPPLLHVELVPQAARPDDAAAVSAIAELARQVLPSHRGGDCTAYALRYAALAARQHIPTRLVTGFALDESGTSAPISGISGGAGVSGVLVRHRWAVSWTGARWISVDPSAPADEVAPARPRLFALAIHDATPEALAAAESAFTGWRGGGAGGVDARWER